MSRPQLPAEFVNLCKAITAKRPRTVVRHLLRHGFITTEVLKSRYGYNHPPRAARDVREQGIPLETFRVRGADGRSIAAYRLGNPAEARFGRQAGRTAFAKALKQDLIALRGARCAIYMEPFPERELQIDHRIPYEVLGDPHGIKQAPDDYMRLCGSANRAKSWSCEHCPNWLDLRRPDICRGCYWADPENYSHIAMREVRRADIIWAGGEVREYERLKQRTIALQKNVPAYVKEIIRDHLKT